MILLILNVGRSGLMVVNGINYQSIWVDEEDPTVVRVIDQLRLPFFFEIKMLSSVDDIYNSIRDMTIRGAPLIGAAGAFGVYLSALDSVHYIDPLPRIENAARHLISCRPTAINLAWAVNYVVDNLRGKVELLPEKALKSALEICEIEKENCRRIGNYGLTLIKSASKKKNGAVLNILTHCNAGWLACIDYGTAMSSVYFAHDAGIPVHVWVDETRPRNQGARLTAWELENAGVPFTLITDNAGGHLMQHGMVDLVIVGCDRSTRSGDVANKIGTYLKALAAHDNKIPFFSAFPSSSFDFKISNGIRDIPVEERDPEEITTVSGMSGGKMSSVRICPENSPAANFGFDVTPAKYITGLITERGICRPLEKDIKEMFSDKFI